MVDIKFTQESRLDLIYLAIEKVKAKKYLEIILKNNPKSQKAKMAMQQLNRLLWARKAIEQYQP